MHVRSSRILAITQSLFGICLGLCLILIPHYFFSFDQGGVSNYGTEHTTKWLFIIGFGFAALGCLIAAIQLPAHNSRRISLRIMFTALAVLYIAVLLSTFGYKMSTFDGRVHDQIATVLFIVMLICASWLRYIRPKDSSIRIMYLIFCIGFVLSLITFLGILHVLFAAQLLCGISFGYILSHGIRTLT